MGGQRLAQKAMSQGNQNFTRRTKAGKTGRSKPDA
jgi:hypothetical protein